MADPSLSSYQRYQAWRPWLEPGFWVLLTLANFVGNSFTTMVDLRRLHGTFQAWEPVVWEASSALVWLLLVVPAIAWGTRRWPLHWDSWRRRLPAWLAASLLLCLAHVGGMVALRALVYRLYGHSYDFGPWGTGLFYEYAKDIRSFAGVAILMEGYRFLLRRWQGEASLLSAPDEGPPLEPIDRPERFLVRKLGREFLVAAAEIEWIQASGNYVNLHLRGHDYPLRSTIAGIQERLDPRRFLRIHRSYLVALDRVASIEPLDTGDARVHMQDGTVLPCSRRYRQELRARLDGGEA